MLSIAFPGHRQTRQMILMALYKFAYTFISKFG